MIRYVTVCVVTVASIVVVPATTSAQGTAADMKWFVGGLGGLTFGTETSGAIAGQVGVKVGPNLFTIGEVGRMQNVMPKKIKDQLNDFLDAFEDEFGVPITFDVSVPATYGFGGLRWVQPRSGIAPFVEGGVGFGHISLKVDEAEIMGIDISDEIEDEVGNDASETTFLLALGAGIVAKLGQSAALDAGYRYTRIETDDPSINTSMVYVAVKFGR